MARTVFCEKLKKDLPGMQHKPWGNALGQRIYDHISQDAWKMWTEHFKMIMNEYRLAGGSADANKILFDQAEKFFFGGDDAKAAPPPDFKAPPAH